VVGNPALKQKRGLSHCVVRSTPACSLLGSDRASEHSSLTGRRGYALVSLSTTEDTAPETEDSSISPPRFDSPEYLFPERNRPVFTVAEPLAWTYNAELSDRSINVLEKATAFADPEGSIYVQITEHSLTAVTQHPLNAKLGVFSEEVVNSSPGAVIFRLDGDELADIFQDSDESSDSPEFNEKDLSLRIETEAGSPGGTVSLTTSDPDGDRLIFTAQEPLKDKAPSDGCPGTDEMDMQFEHKMSKEQLDTVLSVVDSQADQCSWTNGFRVAVKDDTLKFTPVTDQDRPEVGVTIDLEGDHAETQCLYSPEYLQALADFVDTMPKGDEATLSFGEEVPLALENDRCIAMIAPRLDAGTGR
jgi:hypothetical protein